MDGRLPTGARPRHRDRIYLRSDNLPHAFKFNWQYEIPVGRGKQFGTNVNPILNDVIGNWEFSGTGRVQVRDFESTRSGSLARARRN